MSFMSDDSEETKRMFSGLTSRCTLGRYSHAKYSHSQQRLPPPTCVSALYLAGVGGLGAAAAAHDVARMQVIERDADLREELCRLLLGVAALVDDTVKELAAREQFHHNVGVLRRMHHLRSGARAVRGRCGARARAVCLRWRASSSWTVCGLGLGVRVRVRVRV